jgi:hypothetical protein
MPLNISAEPLPRVIDILPNWGIARISPDPRDTERAHGEGDPIHANEGMDEEEWHTHTDNDGSDYESGTESDCSITTADYTTAFVKSPLDGRTSVTYQISDGAKSCRYPFIGSYCLPNDEKEVDRLSMLHDAFRACGIEKFL